MTGHCGQRADRVNGIEMSEQKNGLAAAGKVYLKMIAEFCDAMKFSVAGHTLESASEKCAQSVHSRLVTARRFDFHQLNYSLEQFFSLPFKPAQPFGGERSHFGGNFLY